VPVTVKLRRGVANGSRDFAVAGPRFAAAGAQALTLHPRSAQQMYTGEADHALTAELVQLVDVPVIASGDITSRARAHAVLETTGCAAVMIGRGAQGNPWLLASLARDADVQPSNEEVVAEHVRFIRETVRELGEQRAVHFLRKFHAWYLRRGRFPRTLRQELSQLDSTTEVEAALLAAAPDAAPLIAAMEAEIDALGAAADDAELDLPISLLGGG
jgi:tRNA-dihydrouridine synthase